MRTEWTAVAGRLGLAAAGVLCFAASANASVYGQNGVRSATITVCFVGDALTSRPARVNQIMQYVRHWEYAANVKFQSIGTCAAAVKLASGNDYFAGDIRVVIPQTSVSGTGPVPGKGCVHPEFLTSGVYNGKNDGWGSWAQFPNEAASATACMYNLKLGDDGINGVPYVDHTLHEFGHALGFAHEHERTDVNRMICSATNYGGGISSGLLTPYDSLSVMHYQFIACGINGNYDNDGLSAADQLGAHILYPNPGNIAEYVGTTVVESSRPVYLQSAWKVRGANMNYVASAFVWRINGTISSTSPVLDTVVTPGMNSFSLTHKDFLGRTYTYTGTINVMPPADYRKFVAAVFTAGFAAR
jgi:hypothetical protein